MSHITLVVGHNENSTGAKNKKFGISEFAYNFLLSRTIQSSLEKYTIPSDIVLRKNYKDLPHEINEKFPQTNLIISLHANSFDAKTSGTEVLYYEKSKVSFEYAKIFLEEISSVMNLRKRGAKGVNGKERGGYILKNTYAPCVLLEPFFIDNDSDCKIALEKFHNLANSIVAGVVKAFCK
jgi:N-acetylmuramoyl-L-alanine amidase